MTLKQQFQATLRSRKWWSLIISLLTVAAGYQSGHLTALEAIVAIVSALSVYSLGAAIEGPRPTTAPKP